MMKIVMKKIKNMIVYIDHVLIHSRTHDQMLESLDSLFQRLEKYGMKSTRTNVFFENTEVSYLGLFLHH